MPEIKMNNEELEEIVGGASLEEKLKPYMRRSGPYKCPICGEDYYLGDSEISLGMCQKCFHDPERGFKFVKNKGEQ